MGGIRGLRMEVDNAPHICVFTTRYAGEQLASETAESLMRCWLCIGSGGVKLRSLRPSAIAVGFIAASTVVGGWGSGARPGGELTGGGREVSS